MDWYDCSTSLEDEYLGDFAICPYGTECPYKSNDMLFGIDDVWFHICWKKVFLVDDFQFKKYPIEI